MAFGASTAVPLGYYELCKKGASICRPSSGSDQRTPEGAVRLTKRLAGELVEVNAEVNAAIRPETDQAQYGVADRWDVSPRAGDCEDFALTKKAKLLAKGWPSSALLIALADTNRGDEHALLIVRTDRGDLVLDNLTP